MNHIFLITSQNAGYGEKLAGTGYSVTALTPSSEIHDALTAGTLCAGGTAVVELESGSPEGRRPLLRHLNEKGFRIIATSNSCTPELKNLLMAEGIADLLPAGDCAGLPAYLNMMNESHAVTSGRCIVLDDDEFRVRMLRSIIGRFNYSVFPVSGVEEFFDQLSCGDVAWALANLGTHGFDLGSLIRRWLSCSDNRRIPFIPYKDMNEGLFVHEFITGLNRIARVILSTEEVFSMLVNVHFRKEIFPLTDTLNKSIEFTSLMNFAGEPLGRIFFSLGMEIFTLENILKDKRFDDLGKTIDRLNSAMIKTSGIRWLLKDNCRGATCGGGA